MATQPTPYVDVKPGDMILAEDIDSMQVQIKQDIAKQIADAVSAIKGGKVAQAGDASTLDGKDLSTIEQDVANIVLGQLSKKGGPQILFKQLTLGDEKVIVHNRGSFPVVDAYQLGYFKAICPEDENNRRLAWLNFYIYHSSEKRIRTTAFVNPTAATQTQITVEIEPSDRKQQYKVKFTDMLNRYGITWDDTTILDVLVTDFWNKFFSDPNDTFDEDQYGHSPWFDDCCKEQKTMGALKGELNNIWFKMQPQKTINYPFTTAGIIPPLGKLPPAAGDKIQLPPFGYELPHNIEIVHYDFNTLGVELVEPPVFPPPVENDPTGDPAINKNQLKIMLILCC